MICYVSIEYDTLLLFPTYVNELMHETKQAFCPKLTTCWSDDRASTLESRTWVVEFCAAQERKTSRTVEMQVMCGRSKGKVKAIEYLHGYSTIHATVRVGHRSQRNPLFVYVCEYLYDARRPLGGSGTCIGSCASMAFKEQRHSSKSSKRHANQHQAWAKKQRI